MVKMIFFSMNEIGKDVPSEQEEEANQWAPGTFLFHLGMLQNYRS